MELLLKKLKLNYGFTPLLILFSVTIISSALGLFVGLRPTKKSTYTNYNNLAYTKNTNRTQVLGTNDASCNKDNGVDCFGSFDCRPCGKDKRLCIEGTCQAQPNEIDGVCGEDEDCNSDTSTCINKRCQPKVGCQTFDNDQYACEHSGTKCFYWQGDFTSSSKCVENHNNMLNDPSGYCGQGHCFIGTTCIRDNTTTPYCSSKGNVGNKGSAPVLSGDGCNGLSQDICNKNDCFWYRGSREQAESFCIPTSKWKKGDVCSDGFCEANTANYCHQFAKKANGVQGFCGKQGDLKLNEQCDLDSACESGRCSNKDTSTESKRITDPRYCVPNPNGNPVVSNTPSESSAPAPLARPVKGYCGGQNHNPASGETNPCPGKDTWDSDNSYPKNLYCQKTFGSNFAEWYKCTDEKSGSNSSPAQPKCSGTADATHIYQCMLPASINGQKCTSTAESQAKNDCNNYKACYICEVDSDKKPLNVCDGKGEFKRYLEPQCGGKGYNEADAKSGYFCQNAVYKDTYSCSNGTAEIPQPGSNNICAKPPWCTKNLSGTPLPTPTGGNLNGCPDDGKHVCSEKTSCTGNPCKDSQGFDLSNYKYHEAGNDACTNAYPNDRRFCWEAKPQQSGSGVTPLPKIGNNQDCSKNPNCEDGSGCYDDWTGTGKYCAPNGLRYCRFTHTATSASQCNASTTTSSSPATSPAANTPPATSPAGSGGTCNTCSSLGTTYIPGQGNRAYHDWNGKCCAGAPNSCNNNTITNCPAN